MSEIVWAVVKGAGWFVLPVDEVAERNEAAVRDGRAPGLLVCGVCGSLEAARRAVRELKRAEKELGARDVGERDEG